jgi:hypothetical protein
MHAQGKHAPHVFTRARPWDQQRITQIGRKQTSIRSVHRPGHKQNEALTWETSNGAIGAHYGQHRAPAVATSRKQFGAYSLPAEDALGPVDLNEERPSASSARRARAKELEAPPADTLRWNGEAAQGGRGGLAAAARRRAALAASEAEATPPPPRPLLKPQAKPDTITEPPGQRLRTEKGLLYEQQRQARERIELEEREAKARAAQMAAAGAGAEQGFFHPALRDQERVAALTDPRVRAQLDHRLNGVNKLAAEQFRVRGSTQISGERKF